MVRRRFVMQVSKIRVIHRGFLLTKTNTEIFQNGKLLLNCKKRFLIYHYLLILLILQEIAKWFLRQEALDLNYDGMIIETHYDPDNAWSDAAQQVTPCWNKFCGLKVRKGKWYVYWVYKKMKKLRANIDVLDASLLIYKKKEWKWLMKWSG
jgi:chorismate mutase